MKNDEACPTFEEGFRQLTARLQTGKVTGLSVKGTSCFLMMPVTDVRPVAVMQLRTSLPFPGFIFDNP